MKDQNTTVITYSKIYQDYANRNIINRDIKRVLNLFICKLSGKKILDVGCAGGRDAVYFTSKGFEVLGIDLTPEFIKLAKVNCPEATFNLMDMRKLKFDNESFDGVWACASFLHIPKKDAIKTLSGFNKILKSKGVLFLSVMEGTGEGYRKNEKLNWDDRYFSFYQKLELEKLLNSAGFKVISLIKFPTSWGPKFLEFYCKVEK